MTRRTGGPVRSEEGTGSMSVPIEDVFVSLDLESDVAYVVCEQRSGLRWKQLLRAEGELLASLGARCQVQLRSRPSKNAIGASRRATSIAEGGCP